jgi:hypothetical protein
VESMELHTPIYASSVKQHASKEKLFKLHTKGRVKVSSINSSTDQLDIISFVCLSLKIYGAIANNGLNKYFK